MWRGYLFKAMQENPWQVRYPFLDASPRLVLRWLRKTNRRFRDNGSEGTRSVPWTAEFKELSQLWIDQYSNPNEKTYDILEAKDLFDAADLEVVEMFSLGRPRVEDLPPSWRPLFDELDSWSQFRFMELYYPSTGSIGALVRKKP